jgi:hypothetical protein
MGWKPLCFFALISRACKQRDMSRSLSAGGRDACTEKSTNVLLETWVIEERSE